MMTIKKTDSTELLRQIANMGSQGRAEAEPAQNFLQRYLPLPEHARAIDPNVILVIGDRGAGKTELFRAIQFPAGLAAIQSLGTGNLPDPEKSKWFVGYSSEGTQYPPELVFRQFSKGKQPADLQLIWLGLLLSCLIRGEMIAETAVPEAMWATLTATPLHLEELFSNTQQHLEFCFGVLDALDSKLAEKEDWVFVSYDELDRVSAGDWTELRTILRGLVQMWSSYARRWRRLRPKIFLRRDLFDRVALFGPDVSKIAAQRVELVWTTRNLYALTAKRMINRAIYCGNILSLLCQVEKCEKSLVGIQQKVKKRGIASLSNDCVTSTWGQALQKAFHLLGYLIICRMEMAEYFRDQWSGCSKAPPRSRRRIKKLNGLTCYIILLYEKR